MTPVRAWTRGRKRGIFDILMRLKTSTRRVDDVIIIDCYGHLIFGDETILLRNQVKELLASSPKIVLNLRDLTFMDSGGTGALVGLYSSAQTAGGRLKLACLTKKIRDVLSIVKLNSVFEVFDDEYTAVESFRDKKE
jgi:anti-sigma B factor antagonist